MDETKAKRARALQLKMKMAAASEAGPGGRMAGESDQPLPAWYESAGRGALQGATMGFGDEIYGAYKGLTDGDLTDLYDEKERDAVRANNQKSQEANPWSYGLGELGGGVATAIIPGAGALGTATKAGMTGWKGYAAASAAGGAMGAINSTGLSEAENIRDLGKDALIGGAMGAGLGAAGHGIGELANSIKGGMAKGANGLMAKHVLSPGDYGRAAAKGQVQEMGEAVFDNGIAGPFSGRADIARNANRVLGEGVQAQQSMLAKTPDVNIDELRSKVQRQIVDPAVAGGRGHSAEPVRKLLGSLDDVAQDQGGRRMMSGEVLNDLKQNWQGAFLKDADGPSGKALKDAAREARLFEEAHVDRHLPGRLPEFMEAKGKAMIGGKVKAGMEAYANSPHSNEVLGGLGAVGVGAATGGIPGALVAAGGAVGRHLMDGRDVTAAAHLMRVLGQKDISKFRSVVGKALSRNPYFLGKAGAKITKALAEDSDGVGKNNLAKVAWEEQSNPELQQFLKDEREK